MKSMTCRTMADFGATLTMCGFLSSFAVAQQMPKTAKEQVRGTQTTATEQLHGTVAYVEGNNLVVRMSTGDLRNFSVPETRQFIIDGRPVSIHELKPGTRLTATVTTTTTPITERTTTIGTGKVWFVSGNTVIVTLPNNENREYKVDDNYRFTVEGRKASVHDLRRGMTISAVKIVEEPLVQIASDTTVVGQAPPAPQPKKTEVARELPVAPRESPKPTPAPVEVAQSRPAPPQEVSAAPLPERLPKTGSQFALVGLVGLLFVAASLGMRVVRQF